MKINRKVLYVVGLVSLIPVFLILFANPLLIQNSVLLLDATNSGGHAAARGIASSTGGSFASGGGSTAPEPITIFVTSPAIDARFQKTGGFIFDWDTRDKITVNKIETVSREKIIQPTKLPYVINTNQKFYTEEISVGTIGYNVTENIPYGVHQIPVIITVHDGFYNYRAETFLTIDNTGIFFILEPLRGIFGTPSTGFDVI